MLNDLAALLVGSPALFAGCVFVIGLVVGSFLNVVIYRLPIMLEREWHAQAADLLPVSDHAATVAAAPAERLQPQRSSLRLPVMQGADQALAEHPGVELAGAQGALRQL